MSCHGEMVVCLFKGDVNRGSSERKSAAKADAFGNIIGYNKESRGPKTKNV